MRDVPEQVNDENAAPEPRGQGRGLRHGWSELVGTQAQSPLSSSSEMKVRQQRAGEASFESLFSVTGQVGISFKVIKHSWFGWANFPQPCSTMLRMLLHLDPCRAPSTVPFGRVKLVVLISADVKSRLLLSIRYHHWSQLLFRFFSKPHGKGVLRILAIFFFLWAQRAQNKNGEIGTEGALLAGSHQRRRHQRGRHVVSGLRGVGFCCVFDCLFVFSFAFPG